MGDVLVLDRLDGVRVELAVGGGRGVGFYFFGGFCWGGWLIAGLWRKAWAQEVGWGGGGKGGRDGTD